MFVLRQIQRGQPPGPQVELLAAMVDVLEAGALPAGLDAVGLTAGSPVQPAAANSAASEQTAVVGASDQLEAVDSVRANGDTPEAYADEAVAVANGVDHDASESPESAAPATAEAGEEVEPVPEEKWRKRLYFVRMPKPPEDSALAAMDQEFESLRAQHNLLSESMNVKKLEKDAADANSRNAQAAVNRCHEALKAKEAALVPLRELRDRRKKLMDSLAQFKDLPVRREDELERQIAELHHSIEHESLTLNEEKKAMQTAKKLAASRERVKEYEAKSAEMDALRQEIRALEQSLEAVEADRKALKSELDVAKMVREKYREEGAAIGKAMSEIYAERVAVKEIKDAAYARMFERKSDTRSKVTDFYENRRFSRRVRQLLAEGKLLEARDLCAEQMEEAHAKLNSDEAYRAEYMRLWLQQRAPTFNFDADEPEEPASEGGAKGRGRAAKPRPAMDPEECKRRAEAIIAAALAEIDYTPKPAAPAQPEPTAPTEAYKPPPVAAAAAAAVPAKKPAKGSPLVVVPEASLPEALAEKDNFQLPEFARAAQPQAAVAKDDRAAAAEAEKRKERRRKAAERRREKAVETAKTKEELARAAREAAAAQPAVEEQQLAGDEDAAAEEAAPAAVQAAVAAAPVASKAKAKAAPKGPVAAVASRGTAKRPPVKKKGIKQLLKQYEMYLIAAAFMVFLAAMVHFTLAR